MTTPNKDDLLAELRRELNACPATPKGYREAALIRHRILQLRAQVQP